MGAQARFQIPNARESICAGFITDDAFDRFHLTKSPRLCRDRSRRFVKELERSAVTQFELSPHLRETPERPYCSYGPGRDGSSMECSRHRFSDGGHRIVSG